jgi:hypothetical protein
MDTNSISPTRERRARRRVATVAATTIAVCLALAGSPAPVSAAGGATLSPTSGPVGTKIKVSGSCADGIIPGETAQSVKIRLAHDDAFNVPFTGPSPFHEVTGTITPAGAYSGTVTVGPNGEYTKAGDGPATPGDVVVRNPQAGDVISVVVLCYQTGTAFPEVVEGATFKITATPRKTDLKELEVEKKPKAKGKAEVGKKLTATTGTWDPAPTSVSYQWKRGAKSIKQATKKKYLLKEKDRGKRVSVVVTVKRSGYETAKARSAKRLVS